MRGHDARNRRICAQIVLLQHGVLALAGHDEDSIGREIAKLVMRPLRLADDGDRIARGDAQALALLKIGIDTDAAIRMDVQDLARERRTVALQAHGKGRDARERSPRLVYAQVMGEEVARGLSIDLDDGAVVCHARDLHFRPEGLPAEGRKHLDMKILAHEDEGEESPRHPVPR